MSQGKTSKRRPESRRGAWDEGYDIWQDTRQPKRGKGRRARKGEMRERRRINEQQEWGRE